MNYLFPILFYLLITSSQLEGATLHTIIVGDTTEGEVSYSTECSIDMIHRQIRHIASYTDLDLSVSIFEDWHVNTDNITTSLMGLDIAPDDVVFVYFVMHGSRDADKQTPWPDLEFRLEQQFLDFEVLTQLVESHRPRLLISMAESCNSLRDCANCPEPAEMADEGNIKDYVDQHKLEGPTSFYWTSHDELDSTLAMEEDDVIAQYRTLFLDQSGVIMVSSSSPGELAMRDHKLTGGLFTCLFLETLRDLAQDSTSEISWPLLLDSTAAKVQQALINEPPQTVQYKI